jgi:hypothetical protein
VTAAADTSRAAYAAGADTRATREAEVIDALERFRAHHGSDPTSYELLRWMQIGNPTLDLNAVRPRLTELKTAGRVWTTEKRCCSVTRKHVYTWTAVTPHPTPLASDRARPDFAVQEVLF